MLNFNRPVYEKTSYGTKRMIREFRNSWHAKKIYHEGTLRKIEIRTSKMGADTLIVVSKGRIRLSANGVMRLDYDIYVEMAEVIGEAMELLNEE